MRFSAPGPGPSLRPDPSPSCSTQGGKLAVMKTRGVCVVFCNYFYTYIRLDVSASELFNIFLSQLASPASVSLRAEGVVIQETMAADKYHL